MSLESKIEKLTNAVESLTERLHSMEAMVAIPPSAPSYDDLEEAAKEESEQAEQAKPKVTHDEVQQLCLKIVRDDRSKKPELKKILAEYGATLVADVPIEKLPELEAKLGAV